MADTSDNPAAASYFSGRPLNYDAQAQPAVVGEQASALPPPQPQPPHDAGEQAPNHSHFHGVPGYYKGRVNPLAPSAQSSAAASAATAPPPPAAEPEKEVIWINRCLVCFSGGRGTK